MDVRSSIRWAAALTMLSWGCGASSAEGGGDPEHQSETVNCPAPIGRIAAEPCDAVAEEFAGPPIAEALRTAGSGPANEARANAIRAASALVAAIRDERVKLCHDYDACRIGPDVHAARDRALTETMQAIVDLWRGRQLASPDQVARFRGRVEILAKRLEDTARDPTPRALGGDAVQPLDAPGVRHEISGGGVTFTAAAGGARDVGRVSAQALGLAPNRHHLITLKGRFVPASPPLVAPGDSVTLRLKARAASPCELWVAVDSVEEPGARDTLASWKLTPGDVASRDVTLVTPSSRSGPFIGIGAEGGSVDLDDVELVRAGKVIVAARAEASKEPGVKTSCPATAAPPLSGARSFQCPSGEAAALTLGEPSDVVTIAIRSPGAAPYAAIRTTSLEGGRTLDATPTGAAELAVSMEGGGTLTIRSIEIRELPKPRSAAP